MDWIHGKRTIVERLLDDIFESIVLRLKSFERIKMNEPCEGPTIFNNFSIEHRVTKLPALVHLPKGFSERPRARPPPFVEALFYLYVMNITSVINIRDLSWIELK